MLQALKTEQRRVIAALSEIDPSTDEYRTALENFSLLRDITYNFAESESEDAPSDGHTPAAGEARLIPFPSADPEPVPADESPVTPPAEEAGAYDGEPVDRAAARKEIGQLRLAGVNVLEVIRDMGYDNFPQVPEARLGELLSRCRKGAE